MSKKYIIMTIVSIVLIALGTTYAFFVTKIEGTATNVNVGTTDLKIVFSDSDSISSSDMEPDDELTKTFTIQNNSDTSFSYNLYFGNLINEFTTDNLVYQITSTNSGYNMSSYAVLPKSSTYTDSLISSNVSIAANTTQTYTVKVKLLNTQTNQIDDMDKSFSFKVKVNNTNVTFIDQLLADNTNRTTVRTDFSTTYTTTNTGQLFTESGKWTEDLNNDGIGERVYYFAGDAQNNWVYFGGYYWRIIRTNEDKSVRLLYHGTGTDVTNAYISSNNAWINLDTGKNSPWLVGWMYKVDDSSTLENRGRSLVKSELNDSINKTNADNWYYTNLYSKTDSNSVSYDSYVSKTAIYCNDRAGGTVLQSSTSATGAFTRISTNRRPTYRCGNNSSGVLYESSQSMSDKFSVSSTYGNGLLTYPIALMTADEVIYAGGMDGNINANSWYYYNSNRGSSVGTEWWWTMTPSYWLLQKSSSDYRTLMFRVVGSGYPGYVISNFGVSDYGVTRPVISIKACANWLSGDGSSTNPYQVSVTSACAAAEN